VKPEELEQLIQADTTKHNSINDGWAMAQEFVKAMGPIWRVKPEEIVSFTSRLARDLTKEIQHDRLQASAKTSKGL